MHRILGVARHYDWGSPDAIPDFVGSADVSPMPLAEMWFGAHEDAPSPLADSEQTLLDILGPGSARLPYLVKLLAPGRSVSLQVHPAPHLAEAGFGEDEAAGISRTDPGRRFKDPVHKPEMVFAVTTFTGLVGFRPIGQCQADLARIDAPLARRMERAANGEGSVAGRRRSTLQEALRAPSDQVDTFAAAVASAGSELEWLADLAAQYPGDAGVAAAVLLHRIVLAPGQAVFVPSGMIHAYSSGLAVEVMANSDTVLRAGLTTKLVDVEALLRCVDFDSEAVPEQTRKCGTGRLFAPPVEEFALLDSIASPEGAPIPLTGPRIALCIEGRVELVTGSDRLEVGRGAAAYLDERDVVSVRGRGRIVVAAPGHAPRGDL